MASSSLSSTPGIKSAALLTDRLYVREVTFATRKSAEARRSERNRPGRCGRVILPDTDCGPCLDSDSHSSQLKRSARILALALVLRKLDPETLLCIGDSP